MLSKAGASLDLSTLKTFRFAPGTIAGIACTIARTGYTGEDGVELFCAWNDAPALWDALMTAGADAGIEPIGLGARDTLRLDARLSLYGNDIDETTNPLEAGLGWVCAADKAYVGSDVIARTRADGPVRKLVALRMDEERAVPRPGCPIVEGGVVTSGTFSPTLQRGIGLGYVPSALAEPGTAIAVDVRGRIRTAHTARKPLYVKET